jgi:ArsR family transcriptional regulator
MTCLIVILQYNICYGLIIKSDHFTLNQNDLAILTKALGHPLRIAIIEYLLKFDSYIVNELPLAQYNVTTFERTQKF